MQTDGHADWRRQIEAHQPYLMRFARARLQDIDAVEDVVQDTLLVALAGPQRFLGQSSVRTWLTGILKHKIMDVYARQALEQTRRGPRFHEHDESTSLEAALRTRANHDADSGNGDPCRQLEFKQLAASLMAAIHRLPCRQRDVFVLTQLHGNSGEDVARMVGVSQNNVWVILHRARKLLQMELQSVC